LLQIRVAYYNGTVPAEPSEEQLIDALRAHGHRVTLPRLVVHRHLRRAGGHVTAEQVSSQLARDVPSLSPATVYATLDLLDDLGFVRRISTPGGVAVYDARTDAHHHLVCHGCGALEDLDAEVDASAASAAAARAEFHVEHVELQLSGLCRRGAAA
jgi:Fe2+ or Zn2+ uptake regulation protein